MGKTPEQIELLNEKEWRRELWENQGKIFEELKEIRQDFSSFKIKVFGFVTFLTAGINSLVYWLSNHK